MTITDTLNLKQQNMFKNQTNKHIIKKVYKQINKPTLAFLQRLRF